MMRSILSRIYHQQVAKGVENQTYPSQGCVRCTHLHGRTHTESINFMDPLSITASAIAIGGAFTATASNLKAFRSDYRDAEKERLQVHRQKEHVQINRSLLSALPSTTQDYLQNLESSLADVEAALPSQPSTWRKRDRVRWATGEKSKTKAEIAFLKDTEISSNLTLMLTIVKKL